MKLEARIQTLEKMKHIDGRPVLTLATWRIERDEPGFLDRWPIVAMRRAAARQAEQLAGVVHDDET